MTFRASVLQTPHSPPSINGVGETDALHSSYRAFRLSSPAFET